MTRLVLLSAFLFVACGDDDVMMGTDSGPSMRMCSTTDGTTACSSQFCAANEWCDVIICQAGCQSSANCVAGTFCDMNGATGNSGAGVCRTCATPMPDAGPGPGRDAGPACTDVTGNYSVSQASGNPGVCNMLEVGTLSVTQAGSAVTVTLSTDDNVESVGCTLDSAACTCMGSFAVEGMSVNILWTPNAGRFSLTVAGIICNYDVRGPS